MTQFLLWKEISGVVDSSPKILGLSGTPKLPNSTSFRFYISFRFLVYDCISIFLKVQI